MRKRKSERRKQFLDVLEEIQNISNEIQVSTEYNASTTVDETDLSLRKLEELHRQLHALQKEKVGTFICLFIFFYFFMLCVMRFMSSIHSVLDLCFGLSFCCRVIG